MKQAHKTAAFWLFVTLLVLMVAAVGANKQTRARQELDWSEFAAHLEQGDIARIRVEGEDTVVGEFSDDGRAFVTHGPVKETLWQTRLADAQVKIEYAPASKNSGSALLLQWIPLIALVAIVVFMVRQLQSGGGKAMQFGRSRARLLSESTRKVTFTDVAGVEEAKEELQEIVQFLKDPKKVTRLGGRIPKGVLLMGPPGTGKTLLARAIAGEAGVPFFTISGSDFVEMFVGVGASRVRDLFEQGKKNAPCIIFIDEIDAVGRQRGAGLGGGHDEREQTLNQLLVEMDGFESNEGVILIAATNRPDVLDPALLRPGRFDRRVIVDQPDIRGREAILKVHSKDLPLASDVDLVALARGTPGFTGADLENLMNEAALLAARLDRDSITHADVEAAKDKVLMGAERRSMVISEEEKRTTAYHEAGHALVAALLPGADPLHRVTIIPRGRALGLTQQLPEEERFTRDRDYLYHRIAILMGGRAAEEVALERVTTGAGNDIERATGLARRMVCEWGMSDAMGPLAFGKKEEQIFLGRELATHQDYSEDTAQAIDREVRRIVTAGYDRAVAILRANLDALHSVSKALLERETLTGDDVTRVIRSFQDPVAQPA